MSQTEDTNDITILEYGRLEDIIEDRIRLGEETLATRDLADAADLSVPKVNEAMLHMSRKYDHISDAGAAEWSVDLP